MLETAPKVGRNFCCFFFLLGAVQKYANPRIEKNVLVCKYYRSLKMLQDEYLFAKIGLDTAENDLPKAVMWGVPNQRWFYTLR